MKKVVVLLFIFLATLFFFIASFLAKIGEKIYGKY